MLRCSCSPLLRLPVNSGGGAPPSLRPATTAFFPVAAASNSTSQSRNVRPTTISSSERQSVLTASYSIPPSDLTKRLSFRPSPELGLLSLLFALSMAVGSIVSVGLISVPTAVVLKRSAASMEKLVRLVKEEVPGTLASLRLSGIEISDLTQELSNLRQWISGNKRER